MGMDHQLRLNACKAEEWIPPIQINPIQVYCQFVTLCYFNYVWILPVSSGVRAGRCFQGTVNHPENIKPGMRIQYFFPRIRLN